MDYSDFLSGKRRVAPTVGRAGVSNGDIHPVLFPFQRDLVRWSVRKGRAALFADTGLGKTLMQIEWARLLGERTLIVAPLSVARQTVRIAHDMLGVDVHYTRNGSDLVGLLNISNYEMVEHFDPSLFGAVVLDESSILKSLDGKTRSKLCEMFADTPYRLACTATPAPNDIAEIGNHSEFLGILPHHEMLSAFFVHGDMEEGGKQGWRLKGHATEAFYRWLASWGMSIRRPSDLGYEDGGYILPELSIEPLFVESGYVPEGQLFFGGLGGVVERSAVRRATAEDRIVATLRLVLNSFHADERTESRVHEAMARLASRSRQGLPGADERGEEHSAAGTVRVGTGAQGEGVRLGQGLPSGQATHTQGPSTAGIRSDIGRLQGDDGAAGERLRDLRGGRDEVPVSGRGSRSPDGQGSGSALHELQPGDREVPRQPGDFAGGSGLPQWIIWCGLNAEQDLLASILGDLCTSVHGSLTPEEKAERLEAFQDGKVPILVSKPKVAGFGMNLQNAHQMAFVGLSDSWEQYYQSIRRCWRFGQTEPVKAYIVLSDAEAEVYENVMGKERKALAMQDALIAHIAEFEREEIEGVGTGFEYRQAGTVEPNWKMMLGDSVQRLGEIPDATVDLSVFSPPFMSLFTYSPSERDIGNCATRDEFWTHFGFLIENLLRVTKPGRNVACHVQQVPTTVAHDGVTGLHDFRGDVIRGFIERGFVFHGEVTIDKDPQAQAIRTKAKGLLFVQKDRDRSWLRPAFADYILVFRKPGENATPIRSDEVTNDMWIEWARPIWYGIRESATLNAAEAREEKDERHIAALQLETVKRCVLLWSNAGELILDPFAGIGTTGYVAVQNGRQFVGCELKPSYYEAACRNIARAESVQSLWDQVG